MIDLLDLENFEKLIQGSLVSFKGKHYTFEIDAHYRAYLVSFTDKTERAIWLHDDSQFETEPADEEDWDFEPKSIPVLPIPLTPEILGNWFGLEQSIDGWVIPHDKILLVISHLYGVYAVYHCIDKLMYPIAELPNVHNLQGWLSFNGLDHKINIPQK